MELSFRRARPEDAAGVVPLMHDSSRSLLDYSFAVRGADAAVFLRADFLKPGGLFSHANQMLAVLPNGEVVASVTIYKGKDFQSLALATTLSALRHFSFVRALVVIWRSLKMAPLFIKPKPDSLFIANLAVAAEHRRKGACHALLEHVFCFASDEKLAALELDTSFSNARARGIFEGLGFRVVAEKAYRGKAPIEGFRRMEKPL